MFKVGDKVNCIDNYWYSNDNNFYIDTNKTYTVSYISKSTMKLRELKDYQYLCDRFILLKDYRKQKLEKLCLKLEIK
jgi:hypothetical protein